MELRYVGFAEIQDNGHISETHYLIHFMCVHRPYFPLGLYNDLTHMTGAWTLILQERVTSRPTE